MGLGIAPASWLAGRTVLREGKRRGGLGGGGGETHVLAEAGAIGYTVDRTCVGGEYTLLVRV